MLHHYPTPLRGDLASVSRQPFNRLFSLWLLLAGSTAATAQHVTSLTPQRNAVAAPVTTNVSLTASAPFASGASNAIKVFSGQAGGKKAGTATVSGNTLSFNPAANFKPGETVFTTITSASGLGGGHVFGFTTAAARATGSFIGTTDVAVGGGPRSVAAADVNGDGHLDILAANSLSHTVSVLLNDGKGTFSGATHLAVGKEPSSVIAADVDEDGDLDILTANYHSANVSVWLNNGNATFNDATNVAVGIFPASVIAADVDGDGDQDILTANAGTDNVSVRLNDGKGTFSGTTDVAVEEVPLFSNRSRRGWRWGCRYFSVQLLE
jgi:hypothetical protein